MDKTLLINALIYFGLLTIVVAIVSFLCTGNPFHGVILIRIIFAFLLAKLHPIIIK